MSLRRYGIILKKYLKEVRPMKYSKLTIDGTLMDYLLEEESQERVKKEWEEW